MGTNIKLRKKTVSATFKKEWVLSALRTYKNKCKGTVLPDGQTVGGFGKLADKIIDRILTYYGYTIRHNKGNEEK